MNARKAGWMITAALVMLYVVAGYLGARRAEAMTIEDIQLISNMVSKQKGRVVNVRRMAFFDAQTGNFATCLIVYVPKSVATPPAGQGFYLHDWKSLLVAPSMNEEECYRHVPSDA